MSISGKPEIVAPRNDAESHDILRRACERDSASEVFRAGSPTSAVARTADMHDGGRPFPPGPRSGLADPDAAQDHRGPPRCGSWEGKSWRAQASFWEDWQSAKSSRTGRCCAMRAGGIVSASCGTKKAG